MTERTCLHCGAKFTQTRKKARRWCYDCLPFGNPYTDQAYRKRVRQLHAFYERGEHTGCCGISAWDIKRGGPKPTQPRKCSECGQQLASPAKTCSDQCRRTRDDRIARAYRATPKYRANKRNQRGKKHWKPEVIAELLARTNGCCGICDDPIDTSLRHPDPASLSIDHVLARANGGSHDPSNLQASHLYCNQAKYTKPLDDIRKT